MFRTDFLGALESEQTELRQRIHYLYVKFHILLVLILSFNILLVLNTC